MTETVYSHNDIYRDSDRDRYKHRGRDKCRHRDIHRDSEKQRKRDRDRDAFFALKNFWKQIPRGICIDVAEAHSQVEQGYGNDN